LFLCDRCNMVEGYVTKEWERIKKFLAYKLWSDGARGTHTITLDIPSAFPSCPPSSAEDIAWIRRYIEDRKERRK
jgi:hypothetical protein